MKTASQRTVRAETILVVVIFLVMLIAVLGARVWANLDARSGYSWGYRLPPWEAICHGTFTSLLLLASCWCVFGPARWYVRWAIGTLMLIITYGTTVVLWQGLDYYLEFDSDLRRYIPDLLSILFYDRVAVGFRYLGVFLLVALLLFAVANWFGWQLRRGAIQSETRNAYRIRKNVLLWVAALLGGAQILMRIGVTGISADSISYATILMFVTGGIVLGAVVPLLWGFFGVGTTVIRTLLSVVVISAISTLLVAYGFGVWTVTGRVNNDHLIWALFFISTFSIFWFGALIVLRFLGYRLRGYQPSDFTRPKIETARISPFDD